MSVRAILKKKKSFNIIFLWIKGAGILETRKQFLPLTMIPKTKSLDKLCLRTRKQALKGKYVEKIRNDSGCNGVCFQGGSDVHVFIPFFF